jgi:hypothetical protein
MDSYALAVAIVERMLDIRHHDEAKGMTIVIRRPGRSSIIRPYHMIRDAITVIEEQKEVEVDRVS